jgi:hypothetical protein
MRWITNCRGERGLAGPLPLEVSYAGDVVHNQGGEDCPKVSPGGWLRGEDL